MLLKTQYHGMFKNFFGGDSPISSLPDFSQNVLNPNELFLSDISFRDIPWDKHRNNADCLLNYYRTDEFISYAERMLQCSTLLFYNIIQEELQDHLHTFIKLKDTKFCRVRYCPVCQWRRSLRWKAKAHQAMPLITLQYPLHHWLFLTLTVRNCPIKELRQTLNLMNKSWVRMTKLKKFPAIGWIRSTEITKSSNGSVHPHFHCLLFAQPSYFQKFYLSQQDWTDLWQKSLRVDYSPLVDIRRVKGSPNSIIPELLKYTVKESDLLDTQSWFLELTRQTHNSRHINIGGVLKPFLKDSLERDPSDLIGKDDSDGDHDDSDAVIQFGWNRSFYRYTFTTINSPVLPKGVLKY